MLYDLGKSVYSTPAFRDPQFTLVCLGFEKSCKKKTIKCYLLLPCISTFHLLLEPRMGLSSVAKHTS